MSFEHITYKKKRLPVKLGYYALKMLQKERKASMVSNLMVVLCADKDVTPVVNTGTLHQ